MIFIWTYANVRRMKKIYNLFSLVVCASLMAIIMPRGMAVAEGDGFELPILYIQAINPGYKVDGVSDVGEMIEIRKNSEDLVSLAGVTVRYTNSSGKDIELVKFPENSYMLGESLILRYDKSMGSELSNATYGATLALKAGPVSLLVGDEVVDSVCWTGKDGCVKYFASSKPTALVRNLETGEFEHAEEYEPEFIKDSLMIENLVEKPDDDEENDDETEVEVVENDDKNPVEDEKPAKQCEGLLFSEILSYYKESQAEQFVEFYNSSAEAIKMDGCTLRYKGKTYPLEGEVEAKSYAVRWVTDFKLTKNPKNSNVLEIVDVDGEAVDVLEYFNGQKKGTSWALFDRDSEEEAWQMTYAVTPGVTNAYQEYQASDGYGADDEPEAKTCPEGKYLNPLTGRCKKIEDEAEEKTCKEGYYLNEETGRCKKIAVVEEKTCEEGYYLNEETGRCKKVVENTGAKYELKEEAFEEDSSFVALYAVLSVVGVGVVYVVWEFRQEIKKIFKRLKRR